MKRLPLTYTPSGEVVPGDPIRYIERASIRAFMENHRQYLRGRVLDFGAGDQPYRDLVDGEYVPFEKGDPSISGMFDAVMCNQVIQYLEKPEEVIESLVDRLCWGGHLVMTYPTNWAEVEGSDLWRFPRAGMTQLLARTGLSIVVHELRAEVAIGHFKFALGYGVVGVK